jgi:enterochelin esterase family protein
VSGVPRPPRVPKFPPPEPATSPRITALRDADPAALDAFWARAAAEGTPLVEPCPGAPGHRIVTFLWRAGDETEAVVLQANKLTDPSVLAASSLERLPSTDVWHRSYRLRADWRASYQLAPVPAGGDAGPAPERVGPARRWGAGVAVPDPLCRASFPGRGGPALSVAELPDAPPQPYLAARPGVPRGTRTRHRLASARLGNERDVWLYEPAGAPPGPLPVLVLLDGEDWATRLGAATTLDNLIAEGAIPPLVAVMPDALDTATRWRELSCHPPFVAFLAEELLPWAAARVPAATGPVCLAGRSLGALTALYAALEAPERFPRVLLQSASLWWPSGTDFEAGAGALVRAARDAERLPAAVHLQVGLQEWTLLGLHRHLGDVLALRGVEVSALEYHGGHDALCWRGGLADGLIALA